MEIPNSETDGNLVYAKLELKLPLLAANATVLVKIDESLNWSVSCHGILVEVSQCQALVATPSRLTDDNAVLELLSLLNGLEVCQGSPVPDFEELVEARGGVFMDSTGTYVPYLTSSIFFVPALNI